MLDPDPYKDPDSLNPDPQLWSEPLALPIIRYLPYLAADEDVRDLEEEDEHLGVLVPPARPEGKEPLLLQLLLCFLHHKKEYRESCFV